MGKTELYQVSYGGGVYEDSWERVSELYTEEEFAKEFIQGLGFEWKTFHSGWQGYVQIYEGEDDEDDMPHWVEINKVNIIK